MSCTTTFFGSWGDCVSLLQNMIGGALQEKGNTWTDATIQSAGSWQTVIADDDSTVRNTLTLPINGFTPTTNEIEITESVLGKKYNTKNGIPSGTLFLDASLCDYKYLHELSGKSFLFFPFFDGGSLWATRKTSLALKGFSCRVATVAGFKPDDATQSYPMHIFFDSYAEFEKPITVVKPSFNFDDILGYNPVGLDIVITTAYTGGVVVVRATKTGSGDFATGLDQVTDWESMAVSFGTTLPAAVTIVAEAAQGSYTLTIKKDTGGSPANLAATDTLTLQAHQDDATNLTQLSHGFDVIGGA